MSDRSMWAKLFAEHGSIEAWNATILPLMKTEGEAFKQAAATEAKRRRYHASKDLGCYVEMKLTKGRNILLAGWSGSILFCSFTSGPRVYAYPGAPQEWFFSLTRSPYPDGLWAKYRKKLEEQSKTAAV